jgi:thiol-disulfide isomerase/thioredoxin
MRWLAVLTAATLLLTGCTERADVGAPLPEQSSATTATSGPAPSASALAAQKKRAGIADCPASVADAAPVARGLPDVVLPCLGGGRPVRLAGLRGPPMIINVWAQWCGPCREEAPYLAQVAARKPKGVRILGVDFVDTQPGLAIEFAQLSRWAYPQLADPDKVLAAPLQITGPPVTLFVRPDGTIAGRHSGPFTSAEQIRTLARRHLGVTM